MFCKAGKKWTCLHVPYKKSVSVKVPACSTVSVDTADKQTAANKDKTKGDIACTVDTTTTIGNIAATKNYAYSRFFIEDAAAKNKASHVKGVTSDEELLGILCPGAKKQADVIFEQYGDAGCNTVGGPLRL